MLGWTTRVLSTFAAPVTRLEARFLFSFCSLQLFLFPKCSLTPLWGGTAVSPQGLARRLELFVW